MKFNIFNKVSKDEREDTEVTKTTSINLGEMTPYMILAGCIALDPFLTPVIILCGLYGDYENDEFPKIETKEVTKSLPTNSNTQKKLGK